MHAAVACEDRLRDLADRLMSAGSFALRVISDGPVSMRAGIVGLAFSTAARDADYVPIGHRRLGDLESVPLSVALDTLQPILENESMRQPPCSSRRSGRARTSTSRPR